MATITWLDDYFGPPVVEDEGTDLPKRTVVDFVGAGVTATDDAANEKTVVTIPGVSDATAGATGGVQLAGDLAGTGGSAAAPRVSGLTGASGVASVTASDIRSTADAKLQLDDLVAHGSTDATPSTATLITVSMSNGQYLSLRGIVTCVDATGGTVGEWTIEGGFKRLGGLVSEAHETIAEKGGPSGASVAFSFGSDVSVTGTGIAGTALTWHVHVVAHLGSY